MFFEDEKDFIEDPAEIHIDEDGTVSWEAVLNDSDDDLMAARKEAPAAAPKRSNINADIVMGDELELVSNDDDDDDNEQLAEILGQSSPAAVAGGVADASAKAKPTFEEDYDAFGETEGLSSEEEFDIDKQLSNVVLEQNTSEEIIQPRKDERAKKASGGGNNGTVVLLLFVLVLCIAGGVYWYMTQYGNVNNLNANSLAAPKTVAQKMNDVQKEDIDQRSEEFQQQEAFEQENLQQEAIPAEQLAQENIPVVNEEQAGDVKAQEEQKLEDEKKKVIDVKGAEGRVNPFMPSSKYASSEIPVADIDFDSSGIPKPPEAYGFYFCIRYNV